MYLDAINDILKISFCVGFQAIVFVDWFGTSQQIPFFGCVERFHCAVIGANETTQLISFQISFRTRSGKYTIKLQFHAYLQVRFDAKKDQHEMEIVIKRNTKIFRVLGSFWFAAHVNVHTENVADIIYLDDL